MQISRDQLVAAFTKWRRDKDATPEDYPEWEGDADSYGEASADFLIGLINEEVTTNG